MDIIFYDITLNEYSKKCQYALAEKKYLPINERSIETIYSMGNGYIGTRNSLEEFYPKSSPGTYLAGLYEKDLFNEFNILVKIPDWTRIQIFVEDEQLDLTKNETLFHGRYINLGNGCAVREWKYSDSYKRITSIKIIKYVSLSNKHELGKYILVKPENYTGNIRILSGIDCNTANFNYLINQNLSMNNHASVWMKSKLKSQEFIMQQKSNFSSIASGSENILKIDYEYQTINNFGGSFEEWSWLAEAGKIYSVKSISVLYSNKEANDFKEACNKHFVKLGSDFFSNSIENHTKKWLERWKESEIKIYGCDCDQKLVDFALYHLITAGEFSGNKHSIPARKLSGEAYKGHVFWDTEMYLLPFFTYTKPEIARELLLYRYNTLNGAKKHALEDGYKGASFAWESTDTGEEMTPFHVTLPDGNIIYILSGKYENHISSDIAYAVWKYWQATGDNEFLANYGAEILFETARFCESLIKLGDDGLYHILNVIGPDEYHELIDDNAYTNYLVKKNFEFALKAYDYLEKNFNDQLLLLKEKIKLTNTEVKNWKNYKEKIYSGFDEKTKLYEQFKGFFDLEYIDLKQYEPRSAPMDIILGQEKTKKTQVIKQADVLMFLYLFGEEFSEDIVSVNYEYYEPRTGHGSSLSPGIYSLVAARIGKNLRAYKYFHKNAKIDLSDEFENSAGGIHIASLGEVWMSVILGFAGMYSVDKGLIFNPHIPEMWDCFEFSIKWRGCKLNIAISRKACELFDVDSITIDKTIFSEQIINIYCETIEEYYLNKYSNNEVLPLFFENISVSVGRNNWKELKTNKNYTAVQINGNWQWEDKP